MSDSDIGYISDVVAIAIAQNDYGSLEVLRNGPVSNILDDLIAKYRKATDWPTKDAIAFLVQDLKDERLVPMMKDAIQSPTVETRALAIVSLTEDASLFSGFLVNSFVDGERVDAAIREFQQK
jgi:hypothetical protein